MAINNSVIKAIKILELISKYPEGITLTKIYKTLDLPKATVHDILMALYKEDAIYYKDQDLKTFVIGSKAFAIGEAYKKNSNFINFASPSLRAFAIKNDLTCFASKRLSEKIVYLYKYESPTSKITSVDAGEKIDISDTITGKTLLAFQTKEKQEEILNLLIKNKYCDANTLSFRSLIKELEEIKERGYGIDDCITNPYTISYAFPVYNFEGIASGVISATRIKIEPNKLGLELSEFKEIAESISYKQGYKGE